MSPISPLAGYYDYRLVALSVAIAVIASYAALDLAGRVATASGSVKAAWLCGGAAAMGSGIWAMHYIGMTAFHLPVPIQYYWPTVLLSLLAAVAASALSLYLVGRPTMRLSVTILGSILMGDGIAAMHYIGMQAMRLPATCQYSYKLVWISVLIAVGISFVALKLAFSLRHNSMTFTWYKIGAALIMGSAISAMHYVGMAAVTFYPAPPLAAGLAHVVGVSNLGLVSIAAATLVILAVVFITAIIDKRFAIQAEQLAKSQSQMQTVFDNMTEGIAMLDHNGSFILMNKAAERLLGISSTARDYTPVRQAFESFSLDRKKIPPDQWPTSRALRGDFVHNYQILYRNIHTGETGAREISTAPVLNRDGKTFQVIVTYRDVTERWKDDEARARLASIVESSDDAIIGKDHRGIVTSWNQGAEKIFGYTAQEMIGQSIKRLSPPGREDEEDLILQRIVNDETVDHFDTTRLTKHGASIHVSLTISPIKDPSGRVIGASKIARNITDRKRLEQQLHQSQKLEAIGQLTGGISHDFNNLLGVIMGNLDLLERLIPDNPTALKRVQNAQRAATRGADLTRRLLAFSSREEIKPTPTELNLSIQNMTELAERTLGPSIKILTRFDDAIPPVLVDPAMLESAVLNLVVNARDAMPKGGSLTLATELSSLEESHPAVSSGELKAGTYARVSVSDTGNGMSPQTLEHAFEPFFTTKPRGKGTGLGLAMVYGFVKQSGGAVRIYSEVGYGTTVSFFLPLAQTTLPARPPRIQSGIHPTRGGNVLLVDDEVDLLDIAATFLAEMGYTPILAKDGLEAIEVVCRNNDFDLILTDIVMGGGMNGVELVQNIRRMCPNIKVIYCSGFPADALAESNVISLDAPLLHKPYQRAQFNALVRQTMDQKAPTADSLPPSSNGTGPK